MSVDTMMEFGASDNTPWSFEPAIDLLKAAAQGKAQSLPALDSTVDSPRTSPQDILDYTIGALGDFTEVWKYLGLEAPSSDLVIVTDDDDKLGTSPGSEFAQLIKGVKWRDEVDGADLEDNVEAQQITASNLRTRKRAARRARAREREIEAAPGVVIDAPSDTATDAESGEELESLRRSPDRRALIASLVGRPRPEHISPPTSPSPPKDHSILRTPMKTPTKKEWPISNPFLWSTPGLPSPSTKTAITAQDGFTLHQRKVNLISLLSRQFSDERKYLQNSGLLEPAFMPLNTSPIGIHVFIDMSNISIGFHDCLKVQWGIPISTRVRRIPMNFHSLALVLERGRPAAKRVVSGSDRTAVIEQAEVCGYEANILDRVHKAKIPTPKQRKYMHSGSKSHTGGGYNSASGVSYGETSGSETPGYLSNPAATYKWSEQAVDEILHLKMSHSILDSEKPSTIVLATGDAAEAEYSDGFLKMVERALKRGWMVELVSFKLNTSSLYRRKDWRARYGPMFKWIQLDDFAECLIGEGS